MRAYQPTRNYSRSRPAGCGRSILLTSRVVAVLYQISGVLMEILCPIFWAALIVLFIQAELFGP
jgi:hypothetical protein